MRAAADRDRRRRPCSGYTTGAQLDVCAKGWRRLSPHCACTRDQSIDGAVLAREPTTAPAANAAAAAAARPAAAAAAEAALSCVKVNLYCTGSDGRERLNQL